VSALRRFERKRGLEKIMPEDVRERASGAVPVLIPEFPDDPSCPFCSNARACTRCPHPVPRYGRCGLERGRGAAARSGCLVECNAS
jgi:hypothetical protein